MGNTESVQNIVDAARNGDAVALVEMVADSSLNQDEFRKLVNVDDGTGPPIIHAVRNGHTKVVKMLLQYKAEVDGKNKFGDTPLLIASSKGNNDIITLLISNGADVNIVDKKGRDSLNIVSRGGYLPCMQSLIAAKANINTQAKSGRTALMVAVNGGYTDMVQYLLTKGASHTITDTNNRTALSFALKHGNAKNVKLLLTKTPHTKSISFADIANTSVDMFRPLVPVFVDNTTVEELKFADEQATPEFINLLVYILQRNDTINNILFNNDKMHKDLVPFLRINRKLKETFDKNVATQLLFACAQLGKLKAINNVLLRLPPTQSPVCKARDTHGNLAHLFILRNKHAADGQCLARLMYQYFEIDQSMGVLLNSKKNIIAMFINALVLMETTTTPWRGSNGENVLHIVIRAFENGIISDKTTIMIAKHVVEKCPWLPSEPDNNNIRVMDFSKLPVDWPFFSLETYCVRIASKAVNSATRLTKLMLVGTSSDNKHHNEQVSSAFKVAIQYSSTSKKDSFSAWADTHGGKNGKVEMDATVLSGAFRALYALNQKNVQLEEKHNASELNRAELEEKIATLTKDVNSARAECKKYKRQLKTEQSNNSWLDLGW
eukprot:m.32348 g.32348  ORF g.32348 m.32348 type:complete len:607 (+) comp8401_c0_seq1:158-1978(+)